MAGRMIKRRLDLAYLGMIYAKWYAPCGIPRQKAKPQLPMRKVASLNIESYLMQFPAAFSEEFMA